MKMENSKNIFKLVEAYLKSSQWEFRKNTITGTTEFYYQGWKPVMINIIYREIKLKGLNMSKHDLESLLDNDWV